MAEMNPVHSQAIQNDAPRAEALRLLRGWIQNGTLKSGEALPSERRLSEDMQINRGAIRWALQALTDEGLIRSHGPRTRLVSDSSPAHGNALLAGSIIVISHVLIPESNDYRDPRRMAWSDAIARGAMQAVHSAGSNMVALQKDSLTSQMVECIAQGRPRGLILAAGWSDAIDKLLQTLDGQGIAVAVYGDDEQVRKYDRVVPDHETGAYEATRWLIAQGRRRILNVWGGLSAGYWFSRRLAGYRRAMLEAGLKPLEPLTVPYFPEAPTDELVGCETRVYAGYLVEQLGGAEPVDAIMTDTDGNIFRIAGACRLFGKIPNKDVLLAGYDNYWQQCPEHEHDPSTAPSVTVDKCNWETGQELFRLIDDRLEGRLPAEPQCRLVRPRLILTKA